MTKYIKKGKSENSKNKTTKKPAITSVPKSKKANPANDFLDVKEAAKDVKKVVPAAKKTIEKAKPVVEKTAAAIDKTVEKVTPSFLAANSKKNRKKEINVLKQLYQNTDMGKNGIDNIIKKTNSSSFKNTLLSHYEKFDDISQRISKELTKCGETQKEAKFFNKAMQWSSINVNTIFDKTPEHLADMLIKGNHAGITSITRELNINKHALSDSTNALAAELIDLQQQNINELKPYL